MLKLNGSPISVVVADKSSLVRAGLQGLLNEDERFELVGVAENGEQFLALVDQQMSLPARALAVADIYDAPAADRPYRRGMPLEKVLKIIGEDAPHKLDAACVEALKTVVQRADWKVPEPGFACATESPSFLTSTTEAVEIDEVAATRVF